jgi:glycine/D-amino acid oxidase-like deaminating enzyme
MPTTLTAPDKLAAIAAALKAAFETIDGVTVFDYEPVGSELPLPCITIGTPELQRSEIDEAERQLGADDWRQSWAVTAMVAMHEPELAQALVRQLVGEMVEAIDLDHTLDGEAHEARLVSARVGYGEPERSPRLVVAECDVQVLSLMPRT